MNVMEKGNRLDLGDRKGVEDRNMRDKVQEDEERERVLGETTCFFV